ncbi:Ferric reductase transmembrane component 3 [Wickerhamiella sorbophila]|uniref:ferric-chelate reductase (NADPH) n=1 Tax=Wickerhamiella sorbophila TaxID=45607 RepID=A0A2T0FD30_9ASCO|nr:Ferric reductase transmembrane component 3 [Wickerhamiella sorbophila]PRT52875.1 Ferric reductase transmembrane component 3 [Wickerhamiella sorbophila]
MRVLFALLFLPYCWAMWPQSWIVGMACGKAAQLYYPECVYGDYACICGSDQIKATVEDCINRATKMNSTDMGSAWGRFSLMYCTLNGQEDLVGDLLTIAKIKPQRVVSDESFERAYEAEVHLLSQKDVSVRYSLSLYVYWLGIAVIAAIWRFMSKLAVFLVGPHSMLQRRHSRYYRWLQRRFFWPALFGQRHMVRFQFKWITMSLASRFETVVILVFFLLCLIFMLTPYTFMDDDPFFETRWKEMMRFSSDRSGIMGTILIPLFVLFGMRNNILIWATGWSYQRFNVFHRAIARISYTLLIVHSVTKHIFSASYHASLVKYFYPTLLYRYGVAAMFLMAIMIGSAMVRNRFYGIFHFLHITCGFAGLMCSVYHLNHIGYKEPLYIAFAIWAADWFLRLARVTIFNFRTVFPPLAGSHRSSYASVNVYNGEIARLSIRLPVKWPFYPGQYVYLYPHRYWFINGHPFSVVGATPNGDGMILLVRARNGMTKELCKSLIDRGCSETTPVTIPVVVEGPYGVSAPVFNYDEGLLIAGGIGITGILGYVERMVRDNAVKHHKHIHVIWIAHSRKLFAIARDIILRLKESGSVEISLYTKAERGQNLLRFPEQAGVASGENVVVDYEPTQSASTSQRVSRHGSRDTEWCDQYNSRNHSQSEFDNSSYMKSVSPDDTLVYERENPFASSEVLSSRLDELEKAGLDDSRSDDTQGNYPKKDCFETSSESLSTEKSDDLDELIIESRIDLANTVRTFFNQSKGSVCVAACGPPGMMDTISAAVCKYMEHVEYGEVHYYEEAFSW